MLECLVLSSIIIKPLSCCARWSSSAWARSRFWIANSKNASDKCFNMNKNSRRLWWDRICKIMCIYSNNKCMCVFLISPVPIAEPLTSELIDTRVFHYLAPRPIKYWVSLPIPTYKSFFFYKNAGLRAPWCWFPIDDWASDLFITSPYNASWAVTKGPLRGELDKSTVSHTGLIVLDLRETYHLAHPYPLALLHFTPNHLSPGTCTPHHFHTQSEVR